MISACATGHTPFKGEWILKHLFKSIPLLKSHSRTPSNFLLKAIFPASQSPPWIYVYLEIKSQNSIFSTLHCLNIHSMSLGVRLRMFENPFSWKIFYLVAENRRIDCHNVRERLQPVQHRVTIPPSSRIHTHSRFLFQFGFTAFEIIHAQSLQPPLEESFNSLFSSPTLPVKKITETRKKFPFPTFRSTPFHTSSSQFYE